MLSKDNWQDTTQRFTRWWKREPGDRPLMRIIARRSEPLEPLDPIEPAATPEPLYLDVDRAVAILRNRCRSVRFLAESFPNLDLNLGPGSMALYLGSEPVFAWDTLWYSECVNDWETFGPLRFDPENRWWKIHQVMLEKGRLLAGEDFPVSIPDIIENVDILSALRGPQAFCYDLVDEPERMRELVEQVDNLYFRYYNRFHDLVRMDDGGSVYTAFQIWGTGRTAKVQCDFSALMSPAQFREFVLPSLRKQCRQLDHSLYHLDGPDCIKHVDALMEIVELDALQWTAGAGQPDGACEKWLPVYDKVRAAGKGLWISIEDGGYEDWVAGAERLVHRYGATGLYFLFPEMSEEQAEKLILKAEREWR